MHGIKIECPNWYGDDVYLEKINNNKYKLVHHSLFTRVAIIDRKKKGPITLLMCMEDQ